MLTKNKTYVSPMIRCCDLVPDLYYVVSSMPLVRSRKDRGFELKILTKIWLADIHGQTKDICVQIGWAELIWNDSKWTVEKYVSLRFLQKDLWSKMTISKVSRKTELVFCSFGDIFRSLDPDAIWATWERSDSVFLSNKKNSTYCVRHSCHTFVKGFVCCVGKQLLLFGKWKTILIVKLQ